MDESKKVRLAAKLNTPEALEKAWRHASERHRAAITEATGYTGPPISTRLTIGKLLRKRAQQRRSNETDD